MFEGYFGPSPTELVCAPLHDIVVNLHATTLSPLGPSPTGAIHDQRRGIAHRFAHIPTRHTDQFLESVPVVATISIHVDEAHDDGIESATSLPKRRRNVIPDKDRGHQ